MRRPLVAFSLGTTLALGALVAVTAPASAQRHRPTHKPLTRVIITQPTPYWDGWLVPRYHYRPQDDRVDPFGPPVVPAVRFDDGGWL